MAKTDITAQRLRELFRYEPKTGDFIRLVYRGGESAGKIAGSKMTRGNHSICVDGKKYMTHRLAWLYMTGAWPVDQIDHRDGDALNNRFDNLREATDALNKQNLHRPKRGNRSGYRGVYFHTANQRWIARINVAGKCSHLGCFSDPELAHQAYLEAKRQLHPFGTL